jgi:hypothetical protein
VTVDFDVPSAGSALGVAVTEVDEATTVGLTKLIVVVELRMIPPSEVSSAWVLG